jgi:hypothetical protein
MDKLEENLIASLPESIPVSDKLLKKKPGAPTTLAKRRASAPVKGKVQGKRDHYSEKEKINACCVFTVCGNSRRTAELTKIPEATIRSWKTTVWWNEVTARIYTEQDEELSGKLTKLVDNAVDQLNDRLTSGDYIYNPKQDKIIRKPINARDIASVTAMAVDKRQLLRGKATSRTESVSVDERMKDLAKQFKQFAQAKEVVQVEE